MLAKKYCVSADEQVRRGTIKTQFGILYQPVTKVAVLTVGNNLEQVRIPESLTGGRMLPPSTNK